MSNGGIYLTIEDSEMGGQRVRIPRGWVLLTLTLASWGALSIAVLALWGIFGLPFGPVALAALGAGGLLYALWHFVGRRLFIVWLAKSIDEDER